MNDKEISEKIENATVAIAIRGLCNRLKCLISAMRIADKTSSNLILYWPSNTLLNCSFSDLFENEIEEMSLEEYELLTNIKDADKKCRIVNTWRFELLPQDKLPDNFSRGFPHDSGRYIDFEYQRIPLAIREDFLKYINRLQPKKYIVEQVENFSKNFDNNTIGISIRTWPDKEARERFKLFDLKNIYKIIDKTEGANIFVSADCEEVLEKIHNRYGKKILSYPKRTSAGDRSSAVGIFDILIDLLLLAKCKQLKVSYLSTYSEMAWWFGGSMAKVEAIPLKAYIFKKIDLGNVYMGFCLLGKWCFPKRINIAKLIINKGYLAKVKFAKIYYKIIDKFLAMPLIKKIFLSESFIKNHVRIRTHLYRRFWLSDDGNNTLLIDYPLNEDSIVFDAGGHLGYWSEKIEKKYNPTILIFEPIPGHILSLKERFQYNPKVRIYPWGLADKNTSALISVDGNSSSFYKKSQHMMSVELKDIKEFMEENGFNAVDLIEINIEGGEYVLLQRMIETGIVEKFKNIVIQFHDFYPNAFILRRSLQKSLSRTHCLIWNYPFIWESWKRKEE
jgi:FkbM family methyltransferase